MIYINERDRERGDIIMKISNTSTRLKKIMTDNNMRQVDILKKVEPYCQVYNIKMNKSDISQYVSGKVEPSQDKLVILSMALNVSEAWLMGFDVPVQRYSTPNITPQIINYYNQLNDFGKKEATKRVEELTHFPQYTESQILNAAHERTDINIPTDIDTSDNDIMDDENF